MVTDLHLLLLVNITDLLVAFSYTFLIVIVMYVVHAVDDVMLVFQHFSLSSFALKLFTTFYWSILCHSEVLVISAGDNIVNAVMTTVTTLTY